MRNLRLMGLVSVLVVASAPAARAGTSVDVLFRPSSLVHTLNGGLTASYGTLATTAVADVYLFTSDPLVTASISVAFDTSGGLAVGRAIEWVGLYLPPSFSKYFKPIVRGDGSSGDGSFDGDLATINTSGIVSSFDGTVAPPPTDQSLAPGTYHLGTIVWDVSGASPGFHSVAAFIRPGFDAFAVLDPGGNILHVTGQQVLSAGGLVAGSFVPEPATALLVGAGLVLLAGVARRRR